MSFNSRLDVRELMMRDMFAQRGQLAEKNRPGPGDAWGVRDVYVVLDTYLAAESYPRRGEFVFNFAPGPGEGQIAIRDSISALIEIKVEACCVGLPEAVNVDENPTGSGGLTLPINAGIINPRDSNPVSGLASQLAHSPRVTAQFANVGAQAFAGFKGRRHHFEFSASLVGDPAGPGAHMRLAPVEGRYTLTEPHNDLHGVAVRLFSPDEPLSLPPAVIGGVQLRAVSNGGNTYLRVVGPITEPEGSRVLNFAELLAPGDRVFLDHVSVDPSVPGRDLLTQYLNKSNGLFVGAVVQAGGGGAGTQFELDPNIDLGALGIAAGAPLPQAAGARAITLRIAKNRMRMPVRFRTIVPRLTNHIQP